MAAATARRFSPDIRRLGWPAAAAAGAVILFCCALREARVVYPNSDGDSDVLQAWAMLHGNLLLHGWHLGDVTYYTTELPEYMLVTATDGMRPGVVQVCGALTYTLLVLAAAVVARGRARGRTGLARVAITVAIMIGPSLLAATTLLGCPDHTGTALPVLVAVALIDWGAKDWGAKVPGARDRGQRRWWVPVAVAAVLGWALVADPLVLLIGVVPLLLVCGARSFRLLAQRRVPLAAAWYELSLAAAAPGAVVVSTELTRLIHAQGGFTVARGATQFVPSSMMAANAWATFEDFLGLFSADFFGQRLGAGLVFTGIHLVAAAMVATGVVAGLRRFIRGDDLVVPLLAVAIVANIAAYALIYRSSPATVREIAPVFALGAALAGRVLAGPLLRARLELALVAGVTAALWAAAPPVLLARPATAPVTGLASWLEQRNLHEGIAGYWQANSVTVESGGRVTMRAVREYRGRGLAGYPWEFNVATMNSQASNVNFLIATAPGIQAGATVTERAAIARFGEPRRIYRYGPYDILVWRKNLLAGLGVSKSVL